MRRILMSCLLAWLPLQTMAQALDAGVVVGNESALSIAIVPMPYQGSRTAPAHDVAKVIRDDLNQSGQFKSLDEAAITEKPLRGADVRFPEWKKLKTVAVVAEHAGESQQRAPRRAPGRRSDL